MNHEEALRSIDHHFAGRLSSKGEAALRAHLPGCARCGDRYRRHLVLARIDPRVPAARERLARGAGLRAPRPARSIGWRAPLGLALAAAAALVLLVHARAAPDSAMTGGFAARGAEARLGALLVYRVTEGAAPTLANDEVAATDELAFAYSNPAARRFLSIFGVDEHGHVYWYYPSWSVGAPAPRAVEARAGAGPHELPEAVRQPLDGRRLDLYAVFTDERVGVEDLEHSFARSEREETAPRDAVVVRRRFEVKP